MNNIVCLAPKDNVFYNFRKEVINAIKEAGNNVILLSPYGKKIDYFTEHGCQFIDIKIDRRGTSLLNDFKLILAYIKVFRRVKPDLVLTYTTKCSVYGGIACRLLNIPYIVNNAGLIETGNPNSKLEKLLYILYKVGFGKASCMMYQNSHERETINDILGNKVHYRDIPGSGVNIDDFKLAPYPENDDVITFNYVARIVKTKGIDEFLECAKLIKEKYHNTRFVIYGDYDDDEYRKIIDNYQKAGIIEYGGILIDMKPAIIAAHAVIHPSYYEGMTNVVLEHSAMGRVCIVSDIPGCREGVENGKTGYVFDVKNVNSIVDSVSRFIELPHRDKEKMGLAARTKMLKEFDRRIVTDCYMNEISKVVQVQV
jgi:glycosyltransferase involved in cell wall biosynthesis